MEFVKPILSCASQIYKLVEKVKANKKRCRGVAERVRKLEGLVNFAENTNSVEITEEVKTALSELRITMDSALKLIESHAQDNWFLRLLKVGVFSDRFSTVNERLDDAHKVLVGMQQVENRNKLDELINRRKQDEVDRQNDEEELKRLFQKCFQNQDKHMQMQVEQMQKQDEHYQKQDEEMTRILEMMHKLSVSDVAIRTIKLEELTFPQTPFMKTPNSEIYKGEFHGFPVAIKRFINQEDPGLREIPSFFKRDVETMRKFESPNILRVFGICVTNQEEYLIVMEYCEMGSLRDVLDTKRDLSWATKARMCLEAAQGLYRLHKTEDKPKVHGCLNSSKLFVAEGFRVKLGSFELAQTESSLKRTKPNPAIRSVCYMPPEMINCLDCPNSKECEVYSFGIIMWEIATGHYPFTVPDKWTEKNIRASVGTKGYIEPLPEDCPAGLEALINDCRAYESFHRPSAAVLMDRLRIVVTQLETLTTFEATSV